MTADAKIKVLSALIQNENLTDEQYSRCLEEFSKAINKMMHEEGLK